MSQIIEIDELDARQRADVYLAGILPELSRSHIVRLLTEKKILINSLPAKAGYKLKTGDTLHINFELLDLEKIDEIELEIIYEDTNVLVINKPAGVISHAVGRFWNEPSVASFLRQKTGQKGERAGIVHRLDRATSGVMICAKNVESMVWMQRQFSDRKVKKSYLAIVSGIMKEHRAIIDMPIARNPKKPQTFKVDKLGRSAITKYSVIDTFNNHQKLLLKPETGRTHQLRVHLSSLGCPIVGDILYGGEQADRLYLHATELEITLPTKEIKIFKVDVPNAFKEFVQLNG